MVPVPGVLALILLFLATAPLVAAHTRTAGVIRQRRFRAEARQRRADELAAKPSCSTAEQAELLGLLSAGDTYTAEDHSAAHASFKAAQSVAFAKLATCVGGRDPSVFYLEGRDGGTTTALRAAGFGTEQLFVANLHVETCAALRAAPHNLTHVTLGRAEEVLLEPPLVLTPFAAAYFDGCSGLTAPLKGMINALFDPERRQTNPHALVVGFTLTRAEPSGTSLGDRELEVTRALAASCRASGYGPPVHVLDEPERWGIELGGKEHENTLTVWFVCAREERTLVGGASEDVG
jgi:hypothetical protein